VVGSLACCGRNRATRIFPAWARSAIHERDALKSELAEIRAERDAFRAVLAELRAAVTARWEAEQRLAELYRERSLQRARMAEHPGQWLH